MTHIIGSQYDVARWKNLRVWAERGLVRVEDARDNTFETITVSTTKDRVAALAGMLDSHYYNGDERAKLRSFIGHVLEIMQKAQEQGMPSDPQASKDLKNRRAKSFMINPADITGIN